MTLELFQCDCAESMSKDHNMETENLPDQI
jgi:hypothetical protein